MYQEKDLLVYIFLEASIYDNSNDFRHVRSIDIYAYTFFNNVFSSIPNMDHIYIYISVSFYVVANIFYDGIFLSIIHYNVLNIAFFSFLKDLCIFFGIFYCICSHNVLLGVLGWNHSHYCTHCLHYCHFQYLNKNYYCAYDSVHDCDILGNLGVQVFLLSWVKHFQCYIQEIGTRRRSKSKIERFFTLF